MFLLDTNVISGIYKGNQKILQNSESVLNSQLFTCSIVEAEIYFGVDNARSDIKSKLNLFYDELFGGIKVLPFDSNSAQVFRTTKSELYRIGKPIENFDIAIASIALANNLTLVTNNTKDFENIAGLKVVDWSV